MKLLHFYFIFLSFFVVGKIFAQEESEKRQRPMPPITHQIGLNSSFLVNKVFKSLDDSLNANPYMLTYRFGLGHYGLRMGAGAASKYSLVQEDGYADSKLFTKKSLDLRVGFDYDKSLGKRFRANFALDFLTKRSVQKEVIDSGFDVIEKVNQKVAFGAGPSIGLSYWFSDKIGIYTEASFYMLYGNTDNGRIFKNFPELNDQLFHEKTEDLVTILPSSIFIVFKF
jgi:hypothetical protein